MVTPGRTVLVLITKAEIHHSFGGRISLCGSGNLHLARDKKQSEVLLEYSAGSWTSGHELQPELIPLSR